MLFLIWHALTQTTKNYILKNFKSILANGIIVRGLLMLLFGVFSFYVNTDALVLPINKFAYAALILGTVYLIMALFQIKSKSHWFYNLPWVAFDFLLAYGILQSETQALYVFTLTLGGFALVSGLILLWLARTYKNAAVFIYLNAFISLLFGVMLIFLPGESLNAFLLNLYAGVFGLFLIYNGIAWQIRMRKATSVLTEEQQGLTEVKKDEADTK
jgi:uncharacterized membrane protein HdeD (DUF308 family)